jgi:LuxR family maltose regulon positive regulatory protein
VADALDAIEQVARQNAFLIPLGDEGAWYRYHHLFGELLRSKLSRSEPDRYSNILNDPATACEKRGLTDDAVGYALQSGDIGLAAEIVERNLGVVLGAGEIPRLRSWLRLFPVPAGDSTHIVALGWAWCRIFEGNHGAATELIDRIEAEMLGNFAIDPSGQLEVMRAMVAFQAGEVATAEAHARTGLEKLPQPSLYAESLGHLYVGRALLAQGNRSEARPHLERAASLAERGNTLAAVTALFSLGVADMDSGNLVDAERAMVRAQEVSAASRSRTGEAHPAAGVGDTGLAYIRLNQLNAEEAIHLAERGARLLKRSTFVGMVFRACLFGPKRCP